MISFFFFFSLSENVYGLSPVECFRTLLWTEYLDTSNIYIIKPESPLWWCLVFGGGAFQRQLGHEGEALMNGISANKQERDNLSLSLSLLAFMWGHSKKSSPLWTWKSALIRHQICLHLDFRIPGSRTMRNKCLLLKPLSLLYSETDILLYPWTFAIVSLQAANLCTFLFRN